VVAVTVAGLSPFDKTSFDYAAARHCFYNVDAAFGTISG